ncbi:MAG TPA: hypothetical protein VGN20_13750 [Mucilaginibacter sp.]
MSAAIFLFAFRPVCAFSCLQQLPKIDPVEKLYVHTDKNFYIAGEILWFKIYDINAGNLPFSFSSVAYVDVIDNNHNRIMQARVKLTNATGNGSIYIPLSVTNGNYKFRVYTSWMKNFSPDYYFEKQLTIVNSLKASPAVPDTEANYDVKFFPEGGNLVQGLTSRVAFKVTGRDGRGADFRGALINKHNDTIVKFGPIKFGMGSFSLKPVDGDSYRAVINIANSKPIIKSLPEINNSGFVMQVAANQTGDYHVTIRSNLVSQSGPLYLVVHNNLRTKATETKTIENGTADFTIDKDKLDDGINIVTVFDNNKQPVCERLIFKYPSKKLLITAKSNQSVYGTRKKVEINISTKDQANLSLAVYKLDSLQKPSNEGIFSYLWLRSELKGYIESPDYYFGDNSTDTKEALDNLLLTQGWRRFVATNVSASTKNVDYEFLPEYNCQLITGELKSGTNKIAKDGITGYLSIPGKRVQLFTAQSDSTGRFLFKTKPIYGVGELITQTNYSTADSIYKIEIVNPFSDKYSSGLLTPLKLKKETEFDLKAHSLDMQVQNLYTPEKERIFIEPYTDTTAFYGAANKVYALDDYTRFPSMEEVLREYVSEVNVSKTHGNFHLRVINEDNYLKEKPLTLLDGVPIFNDDKMVGLDPLKIQKLEVVNNRYYYGATISEGIVSLTSYKGNLAGVEIDPHALVFDYEGLSLQREFYSPVYDNEQQINSRIADFRNLLYWSPNITTNASGDNTLTFYTSNQQGKYIGVVEGITDDGEAGSRYFTFEVKR